MTSCPCYQRSLSASTLQVNHIRTRTLKFSDPQDLTRLVKLSFHSEIKQIDKIKKTSPEQLAFGVKVFNHQIRKEEELPTGL